MLFSSVGGFVFGKWISPCSVNKGLCSLENANQFCENNEWQPWIVKILSLLICALQGRQCLNKTSYQTCYFYAILCGNHRYGWGREYFEEIWISGRASLRSPIPFCLIYEFLESLFLFVIHQLNLKVSIVISQSLFLLAVFHPLFGYLSPLTM